MVDVRSTAVWLVPRCRSTEEVVVDVGGDAQLAIDDAPVAVGRGAAQSTFASTDAEWSRAVPIGGTSQRALDPAIRAV
jgi:hypothetical protein